VTCLQQLAVIPYKSRSDPGTENVLVATFIRDLHSLLNPAYDITKNKNEYCDSKLNCKIEALWNRWRRNKGITIDDLFFHMSEAPGFDYDSSNAFDQYELFTL
jgi:hypothetical protein